MSVLVDLRPAPDAPTPALVELVALARDRSIEARQRLLLGVMAFCDARPPEGELSPVLGDIFMILARQAERDMRRLLAEGLADAPWAPPELINLLARDEIEIARPIILASPVLKDVDLLAVLVEATLEHQIAIAARPRLPAPVADAVIRGGHPVLLTALASNATAALSPAAFSQLVDRSRQVVSLRGPLARHPDLTPPHAARMYHWIGTALRHAICDRFKVDEAELFRAVSGAAATLAATPTEPDLERDASDRRLIEKLSVAGQLGGGYLVRAVRERRLGLFAHGLAALGGFDVNEVRRALAAPRPEALYYASAAVGIDRAVFPALLTEIRLLNGGLPGDEGRRVWRDGAIDPATARRRFRSLVAAV